MAQLNFKWGLHGNLPAVTEASVGTVYVTTDEQAMYVDVAANKRIRIQQIVTYETQAAFQAALEGKEPPYGAEFYYIVDANALMKWVPAQGETEGYWKQINSTSELETAITKINTILGSKYFAEGNTATVAGDIASLDSRISSIENIGGQVNVIEGVKVNGTKLSVDGDKCVELKALALKDTVGTNDIDDSAVTTAKIANEAVTTAKIASGAVTEAKLDAEFLGKIQDISNDVSTNANAISAMDTAYKAADSALDGKIGGLDTRVKAIEDGYATDAELAGVKSELEGKITAGDNAVKAIIGGDYSDSKTVAADIASVKETLSAVDTTYVKQSAYNADKATLEQGISEAKAAAKTADDKAVAADGKAVAAQGDATTALNALNGYTAANAVKTKFESLDNSVNDHGTRLGTAEGDIQALEGIVGAGLEDKTTLTAAIVALQGLVDEDTSELRSDITALEGIVGDGKDLAKGTLTAQAKANAADIASLGEELDDLASSIGNLSNVMNFRGAFAAALDADGVETFANVVLDPAAVAGDVIIVGEKEYVYSDGKWVEFGDASGNAAAVSALEDRVAENEKDIAALEATVNTATTGLVDRVEALEDFEEAQGNTNADYKARIEKLEAMLTWVQF